MKRYETYKDSGIEWLGEIPNHWMEEKLKHIVSCNDDVLDETTDPEEIINYVEISDVDSINGVNNHTQYRFKEAPSRARRITKKGDVIVSTVRTYLKAIAPIKEDNLIVSTGFAVLRPRKIESSFVSYALQNEFFLGEVVSRSTGVSYPAINSTDLVEIKIPVPSADEQRIIASYLDDKVGQIDAVIAEKKKMVEDLQHYRKSVISEAVTRGLNPDVPMKDSRIEQFKSIPSHWKLEKLKYTGTFNNGLTYSPEDVVDDGILVLRSSNIQNGKLSFDDCVYVKEVPGFLKVKTGDIIICSRNGSPSLVGKCVFIDDIVDATFGAFMMRYRPEIVGKFAFYAFQHATSLYKGLYSTSTINQLTMNVINQMYVAIPPIEEQTTIADYIDERLALVDTSVKELQSQIEDLKSYKSSLITEAVTGKIDLR